MAALGGRTFLWFAVTAALAVGVGLAVGTGAASPAWAWARSRWPRTTRPREVPGPVQVLLDVVPPTPSPRSAEGKILQVIFFAGLLGFALVKLGEQTARLRELVGEASDAMIQVTRFVLELTPLGTFGLIAALVGTYGFERLLPLGTFVFALYLACALHIVFVYGGLLLAHGLNPLRFFRGAAPGMQVAFVSSSSFASMPVALRSVTHNLGVNQDYAAFAVPLGATIKMDGCGAIYPAMTSLFVAQYFGLDAVRAAVLHHPAGVGAGQLRHRGRARHRGGDGHPGAQRRGPAAGGPGLPARHRPRAGHDAHPHQRHRADAGAGAGGPRGGPAGPDVYNRASSNVGLEEPPPPDGLSYLQGFGRHANQSSPR